MNLRFTPARLPRASTAWLLALLVLCAVPVRGHAGEDAAVVKRASELREAPGENGRASTLGIRGLDAEDLVKAQPDVQAVAKMQALRQNDAEARQFARRAALSPVSIEPLQAPARTQPTTNTSPGNPQ